MPAPVPVPPFEPDGVIGVPLPPGREPRRIVVIRFHAFGDAAITFPLVSALKKKFPSARLDVVTDIRARELFEAHRDVDRVFAFDARLPKLRKGAAILGVLLRAQRPRADVVLDLQRNRWSRLLTRLLAPAAWAGFDRHAPRTALTRYLDAAARIGMGPLPPVLAPHARDESIREARALLASEGWGGERPLVVLNPAGGWETKYWPIERFGELGRRIRRETGCLLVTLAPSPAAPRFAELKRTLGPDLLDLTGRTSPAVALALVSFASLVVSEDSGLMHLAWVQGVPTVALFGSSRSAWSRPEGEGSAGFYSEDLECGACMQPTCSRGDVLCLARVSVEDVLETSLARMGSRAPEAGPRDTA